MNASPPGRPGPPAGGVERGPLAFQGATFSSASLLFLPTLLVTTASGIAWGLATPAGPPRTEDRTPLS
ncbi:hypothetical protein CYJ76_05230 [Kytococcus schroeteri]|uniref:Uncharacterized protein n=2 Tax=Kytococcus schroeteri TaxID=138300 RepID=A0A2I1PB48_9MICO|nr:MULTISPECIES: hypothetical protein [Kytococcus]OFS11104.1 hypothetical protein HMPREF3099_08125 [Kytococcus sp. HMSC28H12]PKZ41859.1 hypothetical protein CYJ76_05230 [Kytococcus schroeteri]